MASLVAQWWKQSQQNKPKNIRHRVKQLQNVESYSLSGYLLKSEQSLEVLFAHGSSITCSGDTRRWSVWLCRNLGMETFFFF